VKTVTCDRCKAIILDDAFRELATGKVTYVSGKSGLVIDDLVFRTTTTYQICRNCSRQFDACYDKFVTDFINSGSGNEENKNV